MGDPLGKISDSARIYGEVDIRNGVVVDDEAQIGVRLSTKGSAGKVTVLGDNTFVGARAIVAAGVNVGAGAELRPGTVLLADAPPMSIVAGNPGQVVGYVDDVVGPVSVVDVASLNNGRAVVPGGASAISLRRVDDLRGALTICEYTELPFLPKRVFFVSDVAPGLFRGAHAHKTCSQFLLCVQGSLTCLLDDGHERLSVMINRSDVGLHIPPLVWGTQYLFSQNSVLAVFASEPYSRDDYIDSYDDLVALKSSSRL